MTEEASPSLLCPVASSGYQELGGLLRSSLRVIIRAIGSSGIGAFPMVHPQMIMASSGKLSDLLDLRKVFKEAVDVHGNPIASSNQTKITRLEQVKHVARVISTAVPGFLKNSICGTVVFGAYDTLTETYPNALVDWKSSFLFGATGGAIHFMTFSGWDVLSKQMKYMRVAGNYRQFAPWRGLLNYSLPGTMLAHVSLHGVLFCIYENTKQFLQEHVTREINAYLDEMRGHDSREENDINKIKPAISVVDAAKSAELVNPSGGSHSGFHGHDVSHGVGNNSNPGSGSMHANSSRHSQNRDNLVNDIATTDATRARLQTVGRLFCAGLAGALAGTISDGFAHYFEPIEQYGLRLGLGKLIKLRPPPVRALIPAIVPSSVGFIAYEFGKDGEEE